MIQERVTFRWKDYARSGKQGRMTLAATEFLRRFFLYVLPKYRLLQLWPFASPPTRVDPGSRQDFEVLVLPDSILPGRKRRPELAENTTARIAVLTAWKLSVIGRGRVAACPVSVRLFIS